LRDVTTAYEQVRIDELQASGTTARAASAIPVRRSGVMSIMGAVSSVGERLETAAAGLQLAGKSVLVTGGAGFLGAPVCHLLRERGVGELTIPRRSRYDLTVPRAVEALFDDCSPEVVLHLAAEVGGIGANRSNPGRYWYANLMMGAHVLELSRLYGVDKLVTAGTVCAYPKFTPVPFSEDDLWNGYPEETNAPYGVAKKSVLVGGQSYRAQYGTNAIFLLPANLYGPRDNFDLESSHVVPALIRKFLAGGDRVVLWGDGSPTREFLYVEDAADALLLAANRYSGAGPLNIGTGTETAIGELAELVKELTGFAGEVVWDKTMPNGQPRRRLDTTRAAELLGWKAGTSLRDGLERTIAWYRAEASVHAGG
jgi:GDP-L-fucose synthase